MNNSFFVALTLCAAISSTASDLQNNIESAHGVGRDEVQYFADMNASFNAKWDLILPAIEQYRNSHNALETICDVGTGTGILAAKLAEHYLNHNVKIVGTDIMLNYVHMAQASFSAPNLRFRFRSTDDTCVNIRNNKKRGADIVIFSSVLHEVYSYGGDGDSDASLVQALANARKSLVAKGRMMIRDFVAPDESVSKKHIILRHLRSDIKTTKLNGEDRELSCSNFADDFRAVKNKSQTTRKDIYCEEILDCNEDYRCFKTNMATAYEFIFRKDFNDSYEAELNERYGFMSKEKARDLISKSGFNIVSLSTFHNPWITTNRIENKIALIKDDGQEIAIPDYQIFVVAEKSEVRE